MKNRAGRSVRRIVLSALAGTVVILAARDGAAQSPPPPPVLVSPGGPIYNPNPDYVWNLTPTATQYFVQLGDGLAILAQGLYTTAQVCSGSTCAINFNRNLAAGSYWWGVFAKNGAGGTWNTSGGNFSVLAPPAPTLTYPLGATGDGNPTYTWNAVSTATGYTVQVGDGVTIVAQGVYTTAEVCSGSTCAINLNHPLVAGAYWWGAEAKSAAGGTWATTNFSVTAPPPPVGTAPTGNITTPLPTFAWTASAGATQYFLVVSNGTSYPIQVVYPASQVCSGASCAVNPGQALPVGSYTWGIQAISPAGSTWSAIAPAFNIVGPAAPVLGSPSGTIATAQPTYTWTASLGATQYRLQVSNGVTPTNYGPYLASTLCSGSSCSFLSPVSLTAGPYTWTAQAIGDAGGGPWAIEKSFTVNPSSLPAPTALTPDGPMTAASPTFTWTTSTGATGYYIQVKDSADVIKFQGPVGAPCSGGVCSSTPGANLTTGTYTWWVQAQAGQSGGTWSNGKQFTVGGCGGLFSTGDFNGDGKTDRLCSGVGGTFVSLSTGTGFQTATPWTTQSVAKPMIGDYNSDGYADLAELTASSGVVKVALSTGSGFGAFTTWGTAQSGANACAHPAAVGGTGDFNGDGYTDVTCKVPGNGNVYVGLSNGSNAFAFSIWGNLSCGATERNGTLDMNGDGKDDWYCLGIENDLLLGFRSTGSSFVTPGITVSDQSCGDEDIILGDFNGDGKTDAACKGNGRVRVSTGAAYLELVGPSGGWCLQADNSNWPFAFGADVDGDGVAEMVCANAGTSGSNIHVRKLNGTTLGPDETWLAGFCFGDVRPGDFNGDGKLDIMCDRSGAWASAGTPNVKTDMMKQVAGSLGGSIGVAYTPSTVVSNYPGFGSRMVATSVTTSDGRGNSASATTTYSYGGGKADRQERRSLGFQTNRTTLPCLATEAACPYADTTFAQTLPSAGQPLEIKRYGGGVLMSKQTFTYTETSTVPRKSLLTRTDNYTYGAGSPTLQTYATFAYDTYGNQTQVLQGGDAGVSGDELQTDFTFYPNTSAYIVGKVGRIDRRSPGGSALQTERYLYDGAAAETTPPTKGDLTSLKRYLDRTGQNVTRSVSYSTKGDLLTDTDETTRTTTTTYCASPNDFLPCSVKNAANETTAFAWDLRCQAPTTTTDPNNQPTTQTYDALCRPVQTTDALTTGFVTRSYLNLGDPNLQRTRTETNGSNDGSGGPDFTEEYFDGFGRTYHTVKRGPAAGQEILADKSFNARGGVLGTTAPYYNGDLAYWTNYEYDSANRLVKTTFPLPDAAQITKSYTPTSESTTDPNGRTVTVTRQATASGSAVQVAAPGEATTTASHNILGQRTGLSDTQNTWTYTYDSLGRLWHEYDPDAGHWQYDYDDAARPKTQTDAKGQVTTMTYETAGRIATKVTPVGTTTYTYSEARSGYYNKGRLTTVTSPADTLKLDYDKLGRTAKQQRVFGGTTYTVTKAWDSGGYLQSTTYPDSDIIDGLGYDEAGRLNSMSGILFDVTYDAAGRPLTRWNANDTLSTLEYSPERGFLTRIHTDSSAATTLQELNYTYDSAGLVQTLTSDFSNEGWTQYGYDSAYRLTQATNQASSANNQTWTYDTLGLGRITNNSRVGIYTYPAAGQPRPHAPLTVNAAAMNYDANGQLLSGAGRTLTWNGENRLSQAVMGSTTTNFVYDSEGERLKKTQGSNTLITPFGDDYEIKNGTVTKFISVEGLGLVAKKVGATTYWIHTDRLGSINVESNSSGQAEGSSPYLRRAYRPYGETLSTAGTLTDTRGWIDQRNDTETGLTYLHARHFDPKLGLFLSPDPAGPAAGLNQFAYGLGDPVNHTDRTGLAPDPCQGHNEEAGVDTPNTGDSTSPPCTDFVYTGPDGPGGGHGGAAAGGGGLFFGLLLRILGIGDGSNNRHHSPGPGVPRSPNEPVPGTGAGTGPARPSTPDITLPVPPRPQTGPLGLPPAWIDSVRGIFGRPNGLTVSFAGHEGYGGAGSFTIGTNGFAFCGGPGFGIGGELELSPYNELPAGGLYFQEKVAGNLHEVVGFEFETGYNHSYDTYSSTLGVELVGYKGQWDLLSNRITFAHSTNLAHMDSKQEPGIKMFGGKSEARFNVGVCIPVAW